MNDHFLGRLSDLVLNPSRLMENVKENPRWWQPVLLILILLSLFTYFTMPIAGPEQMEVMRDGKLMSLLSEADWQEQYDATLNMSESKRIMQSVIGGVSAALMVMVFCFVIGFFARMSGGVGSKSQGMGVGTWAALIPFGIASLVKLPLILMTESVYAVNLGLAALLPESDPTAPLYLVLATYGDLVTLWGVVVMVIGFQKVYSMSRNSAAISVVMPWILLSLIPLGMTLIMT